MRGGSPDGSLVERDALNRLAAQRDTTLSEIVHSAVRAVLISELIRERTGMKGAK